MLKNMGKGQPSFPPSLPDLSAGAALRMTLHGPPGTQHKQQQSAARPAGRELPVSSAKGLLVGATCSLKGATPGEGQEEEGGTFASSIMTALLQSLPPPPDGPPPRCDLSEWHEIGRGADDDAGKLRRARAQRPLEVSPTDVAAPPSAAQRSCSKLSALLGHSWLCPLGTRTPALGLPSSKPTSRGAGPKGQWGLLLENWGGGGLGTGD